MFRIFIASLFTSIALAQTPQINWEHIIDFANRDDSPNRVFTSGNHVIVSGQAQSVIGTPTNCVLRVYTKQGGDLLWEVVQPLNTNGGPSCTMAAAQDRVYIAASRPGTKPGMNRDVVVRAYIVSTGRLLWEYILNTGRDDTVWGMDASKDLVALVGYGANNEPGEPTRQLRGIVQVLAASTAALLLNDTSEILLSQVAIDGRNVTVIGSGKFGIPPGKTIEGLIYDWFIRSYKVQVRAATEQ